MKVQFTLNGAVVETEGRPDARLLDVLRRDFHLTGTKEGCGEGECGACTVLIDGSAVLSCLVPLVQVHDRKVFTIEGLDASDRGREFIERFAAAGGTQCGACTPGIVLSAAKYLSEAKHADEGGIRNALAGNICRCTGYEAILRAVEEESGRSDRSEFSFEEAGHAREQGEGS